MAKIELDYIEVEELLYPNIEIEGKELFDNLGKYEVLWPHYLHKHKLGRYLELLLTGKLAEHCISIDKSALERAERIRTDYFLKNPIPKEDTWNGSGCLRLCNRFC